jgi:hypothetical protein
MAAEKQVRILIALNVRNDSHSRAQNNDAQLDALLPSGAAVCRALTRVSVGGA